MPKKYRVKYILTMIRYHFSHWKSQKYWSYFRRCYIYFYVTDTILGKIWRKRHFTNIKWNSKVHFIYFINENIHCYISIGWQHSIIMKHVRAVWHDRTETEPGCIINCNIFVCLILFILVQRILRQIYKEKEKTPDILNNMSSFYK